MKQPFVATGIRPRAVLHADRALQVLTSGPVTTSADARNVATVGEYMPRASSIAAAVMAPRPRHRHRCQRCWQWHPVEGHRRRGADCLGARSRWRIGTRHWSGRIAKSGSVLRPKVAVCCLIKLSTKGRLPRHAVLPAPSTKGMTTDVQTPNFRCDGEAVQAIAFPHSRSVDQDAATTAQSTVAIVAALPVGMRLAIDPHQALLGGAFRQTAHRVRRKSQAMPRLAPAKASNPKGTRSGSSCETRSVSATKAAVGKDSAQCAIPKGCRSTRVKKRSEHSSQKSATPQSKSPLQGGAPNWSADKPTTAGGDTRMKIEGRAPRGMGPLVARLHNIMDSTIGQKRTPMPNCARAQVEWPSGTPPRGASELPTMGISKLGTAASQLMSVHQAETIHTVMTTCAALHPSHTA